MNFNLCKEALYDEVFDSQKNFRVLLDAMSRPGKVASLHPHRFGKFPEGFNPHVLTLMKTLCDNSVTIFSHDKSYEDYLQANTGAETVSSPAMADYALFGGLRYSGAFARLKTGVPEFPEDSATAIVTVDSLAAGACGDFCDDTLALRLKGPGIKNSNTLFINGMDGEYAAVFSNLNRVFPLGLDLILADPEGRISCLTRTTKLEVA